MRYQKLLASHFGPDWFERFYSARFCCRFQAHVRRRRPPPRSGERTGGCCARAPAAAPAVLSLDDGGFAAGDLATTDQPGVVRWQASGFVSPFEFKLGRVNAIHWTPAEKPVKPEGEFCFELSGADVVFGSLASLDETGAQFEIPRVGRLQVARSAIRRIYRWKDSADLIYLGPNGLSGWREASRPAAPRRDAECRW